MSEQTTPAFGISSDLKSKNSTPFNPGFTKGFLIDVKKEEVGKDTKYTVLTFVTKDVEGNRTHRHSEFAVQPTDANYEKKMTGLNTRIKHIYEQFAPFPSNGIGVGATSWEDFFDKVATAFNTGNEGGKVFEKKSGDKTVLIPVWFKMVYDKKDNIGFPLSPNFIERLTDNNQTAPKTLVIDQKWDRVEQTGTPAASGAPMGGNLPAGNDYAF